MYAKAAFVALIGLAAAQNHAPVGEPNGNPITRPLNEIVPKCKPFTITWQPTTPNKVSVLLLKGPSTNVVKFGPALAQGIANSGSLPWTPASDLPTTDGNTGYGIQIIDDVTGQYQYSTQFGISAGDCSSETKPSSSPAASAPAASSAASSAAPIATYPVNSPPPLPVSSATPAYNTPIAPASSAAYTPVAPYPTTTLVGTGGAFPNGTVPKPTGAAGNGTSPTPPQVTTNAASGLSAALGLVGAAAAAALML